MNRIGAVRRWAILSGMLAVCVILGTARAQPGMVLSHRRITDLMRLMGAPIDSAGPIHASITIPFRLSEAAEARIDIWDMSGRRVRRLVATGTRAGDHQAAWDGRDDQGRALPNGTYFYRMAIDGRSVSGAGKTILLR